MRIFEDEFYINMTVDVLKTELERIDEPYDQQKSFSEQVNQLKCLQRTRSLICWHDTSCISNASHLMILIGIVYSKSLFLTDEEYNEKTSMD
jgi:hypothetical protein